MSTRKWLFGKRSPSNERLRPWHIDCNARPMIPDGLSIEPEDQIANRVINVLTWHPQRIRLHVDDAQKTGNLLGIDLMATLPRLLLAVLPANVLDHLLRYPEFIPSDWEGMHVYFWGTLYRNEERHLCVRYMCKDDEEWEDGYDKLIHPLRSTDAAAVLV